MINLSGIRRSIAEQIGRIRASLLRMVPDLSRDVTEATAQAILEDARRAADRHTRTGALVRSLKLRRKGNNNLEVYHDLQAAPHALFVHWGTKPHLIRPKKKKMLRFVPTGGNSFVFARIVHHPGYKGDPYLIRARTAVAQRFARIAGDSWDRISRRDYRNYQDV